MTFLLRVFFPFVSVYVLTIAGFAKVQITISDHQGDLGDTLSIPVIVDGIATTDSIRSFQYDVNLVTMDSATHVVANNTSNIPIATISGQWGDVIDAQIVAIHQSLLPNGKVMFWALKTGPPNHEIRIWDPGIQPFSTPAPFTYDLGSSRH